MKRKAIFIAYIFMFLMLGAAFAKEPPREISGFVLGQNISECKHLLKTDTTMPIRHMECMKEVEIVPTKGFKSGLIYYSTCAGQEKILRIKLKYKNSSPKFYEELLRRFKKKFGEPDEWQGDPFHVLVAWKWYFKDKDNNKISLLLQHNQSDEDQKIGNVLKLTHSTLMDAEQKCYKKKAGAETNDKKGDAGKKVDWDELIPR